MRLPDVDRPALLGHREVGVVAEHRRHVVDVDAALAERLAGVERLDARDVLPVALQQVRDPAQEPGPLVPTEVARQPRGIVEGGARGGDRGVDVVGTGLVDRLDHARRRTG